jgi:short-subunit dehydrogenase
MSRLLKGMVVVITGASSGIGEALSRELSSRGAKLVLSARRMDRLEALNRELGGSHVCVSADVSKIEDCRRLVDEAMSRFGRIDTLVCNAGFGIYKWIADTTPEDTRSLFATNVFGTTDCIHFALPRMLAQERRDGWRGQVMVVSSAAGRRGFPAIGMYSATKAAQFALAEAMRVELKPKGIAVTSVHPIHTGTEFGKVAESKGQLKMITGPLGQTVEHVARQMRKAIERPRPEVWPSRSAGMALGLGTLVPRLLDRGVAIYRKQVEDANEK